MTNDRIVRIAQMFFDSITFSLKEHEQSLKTEIIQNESIATDDSNKTRVIIKFIML